MARRVKNVLAAGKVSVAVLTSRILGLLREQVMAAVFGAGGTMDAWLVAFRIPNLLRDLFAEGALSSAFVPTFTKTLQMEGRKQAWILVNLVQGTLLMILGGVTLAFFFFSDFFVYLLASGFAEDPTKFDLTSRMVQILSPFLLLVALASVAMGILNAFDHYFIPALAPAFFNVALILAGLFLVDPLEEWGIPGIFAIAIGALAGAGFQLGAQVPLLWKEGFRFAPRIDFANPGLRKMGALIGPALLGVSAVQINVLVNTQLASLLGDGPVSWLSYAFRLIYLPIGLFGVAVGVVNLREVSVFAARDDWDSLKETVANSVKLVSILAVPSTVALMTLAQPITEVLYERGRFTPEDSRFTALALLFYSIGLFAYSCIKVYVPTFYALEDTRTPVRASLVAVAVNILLNLLLVFVILPEGWEFCGLAIGTSVSVLINNFLLASRFRRRLGDLKKWKVGLTIAQTLAAALVMGLVLWGLALWLPSILPGDQLQPRLVRLILLIATGMGVYFLAGLLLGIEEISLAYRRLWRK